MEVVATAPPRGSSVVDLVEHSVILSQSAIGRRCDSSGTVWVRPSVESSVYTVLRSSWIALTPGNSVGYIELIFITSTRKWLCRKLLS